MRSIGNIISEEMHSKLILNLSRGSTIYWTILNPKTFELAGDSMGIPIQDLVSLNLELRLKKVYD